MITFSDSLYFRSHGRAPKGRGGWLFIDADRYDDRRELDWDHVRNFNGTLTEAKQQARRVYPPNAYVLILP
jgi:hypothetical protein